MSVLVIPCSFIIIFCANNFVTMFVFHEIFRTFADVKQRKTKNKRRQYKCSVRIYNISPKYEYKRNRYE
nr:MAG TPA: hypothetical protein [Caudoviricetes sp.]